MSQNFLPYGLMVFLQNMKLNKKSLQWSIRFDGRNTNVNLNWSTWTTSQEDQVRSFCTPFKRRKTPSAIRRDRERRQKFWENKDRAKTEGQQIQVENDVCAAQTTTAVEVSTKTQTDFVKIYDAFRSNSTCSQTNFSDDSVSVQTEIIPSFTTVTQTDLSTCGLETREKAIQTEQQLSGPSVEIQTENVLGTLNNVTRNSADKIKLSTISDVEVEMESSNETKSLVECVRPSSLVDTFDIDSYKRNIHAFKLELKQQHEQNNITGSHRVAVTNVVPRIVDKVLKKRIKGGKEQYLVKFKDHAPSQNQWVAESELDECAVEYLQTHTVRCVGSNENGSNRKYPKTYPTSPKHHQEEVRVSKVNPDIVRVGMFHWRDGKPLYKCKLRNGCTSDVQMDEIPPEIFGRYCRVGY